MFKSVRQRIAALIVIMVALFVFQTVALEIYLNRHAQKELNHIKSDLAWAKALGDAYLMLQDENRAFTAYITTGKPEYHQKWQTLAFKTRQFFTEQEKDTPNPAWTHLSSQALAVMALQDNIGLHASPEEAYSRYKSSNYEQQFEQISSQLRNIYQQRRVTIIAENSALSGLLSRISRFMVTVNAVCIIIVLSILLTIRKRFFHPFNQLIAALEEMGQGNYRPIKLEDGADYEFELLTTTFNQISALIEQRQSELEAKNRELDLLNTEISAQNQELEASFLQIQESQQQTELFMHLINLLSEERLDSDALARLVGQTLSDRLNIPLVAVYLKKQQSTTYYLAYSFGADNPVTSFIEGVSFLGQVVEKNKPYYLTAGSEEGLKTTLVTGATAPPYQAYIPIVYRNETFGLVAAASWQMLPPVLSQLVLRAGAHFYNARLYETLMETYDNLHDQASMVEELNAQLELERDQARRDHGIVLTMLEAVEDALVFHLNDGRIYAHNDRFARLAADHPLLSGWDTNVDIREVFDGLVATVENPNEISEFMNNTFKDIDWVGSITAIQREPFSRVLHIYTAPVKRGDVADAPVIGRLWSFRDITKDFEVNRMKNEFVSTVSHELRTPLSSILGFTELMLNREVSPEKQKKYLKTIYNESKRLTDLINDFLDIQRIESGRVVYEIKDFDIVPLCQELAQMYGENAERFSFRVEAPGPVYVRGDVSKVNQVLGNLLSNAVKYSPNGGEIRLIIEPDQDTVRIKVTDQGLGIPKEALPHIFEHFYRVDNSDRRNIGGTGLGLSIAHKLVTGMGGNLEVESFLGQGSTFIVTLPASRESNFKVRIFNPEGNETILIAEDDEAMVNMLVERLAEKNYRIVATSQGAQVIDILQKFSPSVVILDLTLADHISGWDIVDLLKEKGTLKAVPVIISSAQELPNERREESLALAGYFVKPYDLSKLAERIALLIEEHHPHLFLSSSDAGQLRSTVEELTQKGFIINIGEHGELVVTYPSERRPSS